jgi:hypothetical protein
MLYASSRSTLISSLGLRTQRLQNTIIATSKGDLTFPEDDKPISLEDLSIREKELVEIKAAEAESTHGTGKRTQLMSSSGISFPVSEEARNALAALQNVEGEELIQLVFLRVNELILVYR